jgi:hypothetical protein
MDLYTHHICFSRLNPVADKSLFNVTPFVWLLVGDKFTKVTVGLVLLDAVNEETPPAPPDPKSSTLFIVTLLVELSVLSTIKNWSAVTG